MEGKESERTVKTSDDVLIKVYETHYKKKEILYMLSASKDFRIIKCKRKKSLK